MGIFKYWEDRKLKKQAEQKAREEELARIEREESEKLAQKLERERNARYRTTVHERDAIFANNPNVKSKSKEQVRHELLQQKRELLFSLGYINEDGSRKNKKVRKNINELKNMNELENKED